MLKGLGFLALRALPLLLLATPAWAVNDTLYINSQLGDYVGGGQSVTYTDSNGTFSELGKATAQVTITLQGSSGLFWTLAFKAPTGSALAPGNYDGALTPGVQSPLQPGLSVSGDARSCQIVSGHFVVRAITIDGSGNVTSLAADFQQQCPGSTGALLGAIRYNSSIPFPIAAPTADAGLNQSILQGATVNLDGSQSMSGNGSITGYSWTQLSGPTVALANPSAAITSFTAPDVDLGGADVVLQLEVDNSLSLSSTATVTVHVANPADPVSVFAFSSDTGDTIGGGKTLSFTPQQALFTPAVLNSASTGNGAQIGVNAGGSNQWSLSFVAPVGQTLQANTSYDLAQLYPKQPAGIPGLNALTVFSFCPTLTGRFTVIDLQTDGDGNLTSFAADFDEYCQGAVAGLHGKIRYNSTVPLDDPWANAGPPQVAPQGSTVTLSAAASIPGDDGETITSYQWVQLSGPTVTLSDPTAATPSFATPGVDPGGADIVFQLTITSSDGLTSTDTVTVHVANPVDPLTILRIASDPADPIGQGRAMDLNTYQAVFTANTFKPSTFTNNGSGVSALVNAGFGNTWSLTFEAPAGQSLHVGTYDLAGKYPTPTGSNFPGLNVIISPLSCNLIAGHFVVLDIQTNSNGALTSFAADFEQFCNGASGPLRGKIRYNSSVSVDDPRADAGQPMWVMQGDTADLNSDASDAGGGGVTISSYQWTQLSGTAVSLSDPTAADPTFTAPNAPLGGMDLSFQLTIVNSLGLTSSTTVKVHVANSADPTPSTMFYVNSDAGDPVAQGLVTTIDSTQAAFAVSHQSNGLQTTISGTGNDWVIALLPPTGQTLQAGKTYDLANVASLVPVSGSAQPGLSVTYNSSGCGGIVGRFAILDLQIDSNGKVLSMAADLLQHCDGLTPALRGKLRYNSGIALTAPFADAGTAQQVGQGANVTLGGSSYAGGGGETITAYQWTELSGPSVSLSDTTVAAPTFTAPAVNPGGADITFQLTVTNSGGLSGSDTVTIHVTNPADPVSVLYVSSAAGDPVGKGQITNLNSAIATFGPSILGAGGEMVTVAGYQSSWNLQFAPPKGETLQIGTHYDLAQGIANGPPNLGGMNVAGIGGSCNDGLVGNFVILDIQTNGNQLISFAADFDQFCNGSTAGLHGKLRFNSSVPLDTPFADAGGAQAVTQGNTVTLSGGTSDAGGGSETITSYQWTQISGPSVTLSDPTGATTTFDAPDVTLSGADLVFQLTVTNSDGQTSTDTITVHVNNPASPKTVLYMQSDPGDFIGDGVVTNLGTLDAAFTLGNSSSSVDLTVNGGSSDNWDLGLQAPQGQTLQAGQTYTGAEELAAAGIPRLDVSGDGRGCDATTGLFTIRDFQTNGSGNLTSFAVDFVQHCEGNTPALYGWARYNSAVPLDGAYAVAGPAQTTYADFPVILDGSNSHVGPDGTPSYTWTQVVAKGDPVVIIAPLSGAKASFSAPEVSAGGRTLTFQLTVSDGDGHSSTATTTVTVGNENDKKTVLYYESDPGDVAAQGTSGLITSANDTFSQPFDLGGLSASIDGNLPISDGAWTLGFSEGFSPATTGLFASNPVTHSPNLFVSLADAQCASVSGTFIVRDIAHDPGDNGVSTLAVDFLQHCDGSSAVLRGAYRYNSTVPILINEPTAYAGPNQQIQDPGTVTLDGSASFPAWGTIVSYQWKQLGGAHVTLAKTNTAITSFNVPESMLIGAGANLVFQLTVKNSLGLSSTSDVTITAKRPAGTTLSLQSDVGDPIGHGQPATYAFTDAAVRLQGLSNYGASAALSGNGNWTLDFVAPMLSVLKVGTYSNALLFHQHRGGVPLMDVSTASAKCSAVNGSFAVRDIQYGSGHTIDSLAVDFVQHCNGIGPALYGKFRYHSAVP